ncbi:ABC transporter substrate-binding protein [Brevibacillus humidisoli]|uniref:ABC transporter substrate-binding protein n=1 Tax=Brevibacillus humidisoli TaxID=2895522 RepID=UPI001E6137D2|nr:ABC transporter substrate-binding protein [Brevibacillus humidisoli]UFJ42493.1 ABC transporter substrate-binding protein [Brevibacillus humidisoli]
MQLLDDYLRLVSACGNPGTGRAVEISLAEVAEILCCTERNAKLVIKKMQTRHWLAWEPGRGRGHRSRITFFFPADELLFTVAREWVLTGEIQTARRLIARQAVDYPKLAERFQRWMLSQFGLHVESQGKRRCDTLRLCYEDDMTSWQIDPAFLLLRSESHLSRHVFDCLVAFDHEQEEIVPQLAHHWERNESATEWLFYLCKGVLFHHGRVCDSHDVLRSLLRLQQLGSATPHHWLVEEIKQIEAVDDVTIRIQLHRPNHLFLHFLSKEPLAIIPCEYVEQAGEGFGRMPVGTGPFRLLRNDHSMLVMEAFNSYFGQRPFLDRVEIWFVPELAVAQEQQDEPPTIHLAPPAIEQVPTEDSNSTPWKRKERRESCFQYMSINAAKPGIGKRKAFWTALDLILDRRELIAQLGGSREQTTEWTIFPASSQPSKPERTVAEDQIISSLLEQCGYHGETLYLYTYPEADHLQDAEWIVQRCQEYGISLEVIAAGPAELANPFLLQQADLVLDSANMDEREERSLLEFLYSGIGSLRYHLPAAMAEELGKLSSRLLATPDVHERSVTCRHIINRLLDERIYLPLYSNRIEMMVHHKLHGIRLNAYGWIDYRQVFLRG